MAVPSPEATSSGSLTEEAEHLVSLSAELSHLGNAVTAAALLTESLALDSLPSEEAKAQVPSAVTAVLELVQTRLAQMRRVLRGAEDPAALLSPHNATGEPRPGDDADVVLRPWRPAQRAAHHAQQQAAAERDEEREKPVPQQEG
jgi:hypothetical protein